MTNGQNVARSRHLEELANAAKRYTLREILDVTEAVATELGGLSIANSYTLPTASTSTKGGVKIGSGLQMDGDTLNVTIQSGSSGGTVLDTVPLTVGGGIWYEVTDNVPALWVRYGNYDFRYSHDKARFVGNTDDAIVAYLPFDVSATADGCGNTWTVAGTASLSSAQSKFANQSLYLNGNSCLKMDNGIMLGGQDFTIDCWVYIISSNYGRVFEISINETNGSGYTRFLCEFSNQGYFDTSITDHAEGTSPYQSRNEWHHCAMTYSHAKQKTLAFVDGQPLATLAGEIPRALFQQIFISETNYFNGTGRIEGYYNHFRIHDGVALWTENFTPPTAADYA